MFVDTFTGLGGRGATLRPFPEKQKERSNKSFSKGEQIPQFQLTMSIQNDNGPAFISKTISELSSGGYTLPGASVFSEDRMGKQNPKTDSGEVVPGNRNTG